MTELIVSDKRAKFTSEPFANVLEGLTVQDFQRSMILAQGEFAAFLKADERERASILERLTNTVIYKRIGQRAAAHMRVHRESYEALKTKAERLNMLPADEVEQLQTQLDATTAQEAELKVKLDAHTAAIAWLERRIALEQSNTTSQATLVTSQEASQTRDEDRRKLELDAHYQPAGLLLREIRRLENELSERRQNLEELGAQTAELERELPQAAYQELSARDLLMDQMKAQKELLPLLQQTRLDRLELQHAKREHTTIQDSLTASTQKLAAHTHELTKSKETATALQTDVETASRELDTLVFAEPLFRDIAGFEARHERIARDKEALNTIKQRAATAGERYIDFSNKAQSLRAQLADSTTGEPLQATLDACKKELAQALDTAPDIQTRRQWFKNHANTLQTRGRALDKAQRLAEEFNTLGERRTAFSKQIDELEMSLMAISSRVTTVQTEYGNLADSIELEQRKMEDVRFALSLGERRRALTEDHACPLCGSHDHPHTQNDETHQLDQQFQERFDALDRQINQLELKRNTLGDRRDTLRTEQTVVETTLNEKRHQFKELEPKRVELMEQLAAQLATAGLTSAPRVQAIQTALTDTRRAYKENEDAHGALNSAENALMSAERALLAYNKETEGQRSALQALDIRIEESKSTKTQLEHDHEARRSAIVQQINALSDALQDKGIEVAQESDSHPKLTALAAALNQARALLERLKAATDTCNKAKHNLEQANHACESLGLRVDEATAAHTKLEEALKLRQLEVDRLQKKRNNSTKRVAECCEMPLDQLPELDVLEQQLATRVDTAEKTLKEATARTAELQRSLDSALMLQNERQRQIKVALAESEERRTQLDTMLEGLEIDNVELLDQAMLTPEQRTRLSAELEALDKAVQAAQARAELAEQHMSEHLLARPEATLDDAQGVEEHRAAHTEASSLHKEQFRTLVHLQQTLEKHHAQVSALSELSTQLEQARTEYDVALELHKVIGVNDGNSFREFAQILNLQELIDKANSRLEWLNPRYSLTTDVDKDDRPRLGFAVLDSHHARAERPLTTLSGGETFIVSLALALALADFRTVEMPIETLLLDEGLGTLDSETLNTVMNALERLHGGGTQIGIISHVDGLKERIEARVVVEKQGGGRSYVRFEFGDGT